MDHLGPDQACCVPLGGHWCVDNVALLVNLIPSPSPPPPPPRQHGLGHNHSPHHYHRHTSLLSQCICCICHVTDMKPERHEISWILMWLSMNTLCRIRWDKVHLLAVSNYVTVEDECFCMKWKSIPYPFKPSLQFHSNEALYDEHKSRRCADGKTGVKDCKSDQPLWQVSFTLLLLVVPVQCSPDDHCGRTSRWYYK